MNNNQGFIIKLALFVIALVIILSLLRIKISSLMDNPYMRENFGFVWDKLQFIWDNYLREQTDKVYGLLHDLIWAPLSERLLSK